MTNRPKREQLSDEVAAKLKREVVRIGRNGTRKGFEFARRMFELCPELINA